jgi:peptide chain release factor 1
MKNQIKLDTTELKEIQDEFEQINSLVQSGEANALQYKKHSELLPLIDMINEKESLEEQIKQAKEMISEEDKEFAELAKEDLKELKKELRTLKIKLDRTLHPPETDKFDNVIMEIRAGAGGDEASLFAQELQRMYTSYAHKQGWKVQVIDISHNPEGGIKRGILRIEGEKAYKHLIQESGVHRVQRVPVTESSGRIHTSTASVAVLPEVKDIEIDIKPSDLELETMKGSGPGGQSVNTTNSAVRITHKPTGIAVECRETKSMNRNRERAMDMIKSKLYQEEKQKQQAKREGQRAQQIGSGDRSEKIRTYNFQQDRITDHRLKENWHNIEKILDGFLDEIIEAFEEARE